MAYFLPHDEVNAVVLVKRAFAAEMERMFAADMTQATRIDSAQWKPAG